MRLMLFVVALIAGGAAYWLWLTQARFVPLTADMPVSAQSVPVLVAAQDIAEGAVFAEADVAWAEVPVTDLVAGMSVQGTEPDAAQRVVGTVAQSAIAAGAPILRPAAERAVGSTLAELVAADKRAFAIVVSEASAVGGLVQPGDRIDLLQVRAQQGGAVSEIVAENLLVLAVDQRLAPEIGGAAGRTLTLELTPDALRKISAAASAGGLTVALRGSAP